MTGFHNAWGSAGSDLYVDSDETYARMVSAASDFDLNWIDVLPMVYPAVPYDSARLRFFVNCTHTPEQIRFTLDVVASELEALQQEEDWN